MIRNLLLALLLVLSTQGIAACQREEPLSAAPAAAPVTTAEGEQPPPAPPLREDFEGEPVLSLFPRVGAYCPEEDDREGLAFWLTYIDHLVRISGPVKGQDGIGFAIRGIRTIDSVGFFSPLAVKPDSTYRVSFRAWTDLPAGGSAGAGILEFDEFLWVPGQYPKSLSDKHFQRGQDGVRLTGRHGGTSQSFSFRTGPKTRMIHLVFFREGTSEREPLVIDDIEIKAE